MSCTMWYISIAPESMFVKSLLVIDGAPILRNLLWVAFHGQLSEMIISGKMFTEIVIDISLKQDLK